MRYACSGLCRTRIGFINFGLIYIKKIYSFGNCKVRRMNRYTYKNVYLACVFHDIKD